MNSQYEKYKGMNGVFFIRKNGSPIASFKDESHADWYLNMLIEGALK